MVHDEYYGTPRRYAEDALKHGFDVIMAIDVQGAMSVRRKHPAAVLVFVLPTSLETLKARLARRREAQDSAAKRLANSRGELAAVKDYDYVVVNDDLDKAVSQIFSILTAESLRTSRLDPSHLAAATA